MSKSQENTLIVGADTAKTKHIARAKDFRGVNSLQFGLVAYERKLNKVKTNPRSFEPLEVSAINSLVNKVERDDTNA